MRKLSLHHDCDVKVLRIEFPLNFKSCSPQIWVSHGSGEASKPPARASSQNTHALFCFCRVSVRQKQSVRGRARAKIKTGPLAITLDWRLTQSESFTNTAPQLYSLSFPIARALCNYWTLLATRALHKFICDYIVQHWHWIHTYVYIVNGIRICFLSAPHEGCANFKCQHVCWIAQELILDFCLFFQILYYLFYLWIVLLHLAIF